MPSPLGAVALDPEGAPVGGGEPSGVRSVGWFGEVAEVFEPEVFGLGLAPWSPEVLGPLDSLPLADPG